ncbi:MAG: hypothetical protein KAS07_02065 [Candidatus Pacebacteria bacterium]|nr:hypothetical protein [Candidatus Paceibacterota bacterium]
MSERYSKEDLILDLSSEKPESGAVKVSAANEETVLSDEQIEALRNIHETEGKIDNALGEIEKEVEGWENKNEKESKGDKNTSLTEEVPEKQKQETEEEIRQPLTKEVEMSPEQVEKAERIKDTLNKRKGKIREALSSILSFPGERIYARTHEVMDRYRKLSPGAKALLTVGIMGAVVAWSLWNKTNDDLNTTVQTFMDSLGDVDAGNIDVNEIPMQDATAENFMPQDSPESSDIAGSSVDGVAAQGSPKNPDVHQTPFTHEVVGGDNNWDNIEGVLDDGNFMEGYTKEQRNFTIDSIKDELVKLSPEELKNIGNLSGDPSLIDPGDKIDYTSVIEAAVEKNPDLLSHPLDNSVASAEIPVGDISVSNSSPAFIENSDPVGDAMFGEQNSQTDVGAETVAVGDERNVPVSEEEIKLQSDMDTQTANSTSSVVEAADGDLGVAQGVDMAPEAAGTQETISAPHDSIQEPVLERLAIDQSEAERFFESRKMPSFLQGYSGLFSGEGYLNNWIDPNSGVAACEINDFLFIDADKLSGEIGVESKDFVQKTKDLINTLRDNYGNVIPKAEEQKTVFEWLQKPLGPLNK